MTQVIQGNQGSQCYGVDHYLIAWDGFDTQHDTWEPVENLPGSEADIEGFFKQKTQEAEAAEALAVASKRKRLEGGPDEDEEDTDATVAGYAPSLLKCVAHHACSPSVPSMQNSLPSVALAYGNAMSLGCLLLQEIRERGTLKMRKTERPSAELLFGIISGLLRKEFADGVRVLQVVCKLCGPNSTAIPYCGNTSNLGSHVSHVPQDAYCKIMCIAEKKAAGENVDSLTSATGGGNSETSAGTIEAMLPQVSIERRDGRAA
ncbi:hypothetical protein CYMTET_56745 [Cymbomonas tetramitiformis]|uniref:Chromo domain-containing protein n=1 Tax=Cymbomonas tetramitiformis TaxID=36881 RepID=A0AAE0ELI7_9CHLO|nr:hypothetical protein CYMTET_56745 [Cymbomonas tetramitiformis]